MVQDGHPPGWFCSTAEAEGKQERSCPLAEGCFPFSDNACGGLASADFMDNVSTHKVDGVEEAIAARGARAVFLPAYSPDLNPIEQLFARLKSFLRKMKARTIEELWRAI